MLGIIKEIYRFRLIGLANNKAIFSKIYEYDYRPIVSELENALKQYVLAEGALYDEKVGLSHKWDGKVIELEGVRRFETANF